MNILVLTPDRVGSSFLQRVITVYMNAHAYDKNIINCHDLTDGLLYKYFHTDFNQEVLGYDYTENINQHFTLPEIIDLLDQCDHYKVARVCWLHLQNRFADSEDDRQRFYRYLNQNFYIISGRRHNLFEYALSWALAKESCRMNCYSTQDKFNNFSKIYENKITVDPEVFIHHVYQYREYCHWADNCFKINSLWFYDRDITHIDRFISRLNIFNGQPTKTWEQIFGIDFQTWNQCHYLDSDISGLGKQLSRSNTPLLTDGRAPALETTAHLTPTMDLAESLARDDQLFLQKHGEAYTRVVEQINHLVASKILPTPIPVKLQTFFEKCLMVKNLGELIDTFNERINDPRTLIHKISQPVNKEIMLQQICEDHSRWHRYSIKHNDTNTQEICDHSRFIGHSFDSVP